MKGGGGGGVGLVSKGGLKCGVGASLAKWESSMSTPVLVSIAWLRDSSSGRNSMNGGRLLCSAREGWGCEWRGAKDPIKGVV